VREALVMAAESKSVKKHFPTYTVNDHTFRVFGFDTTPLPSLIKGRNPEMESVRV
jgi:hypothetical protein